MTRDESPARPSKKARVEPVKVTAEKVSISPRKMRGERIYGYIKKHHSKLHELLTSISTAKGITNFSVEGRVDSLNFKLEIDLNDHANTIATGCFGVIAFNSDSFFFRGLSKAKFAGKIKNGVAYLEIDPSAEIERSMKIRRIQRSIHDNLKKVCGSNFKDQGSREAFKVSLPSACGCRVGSAR